MGLSSNIIRVRHIVVWTIVAGLCLNTSVVWGDEQVSPEEEFDDLFSELDLAFGIDATSIYEGDNDSVEYFCKSIEAGDVKNAISFLKDEQSIFKKKLFGDGGYYTNTEVLLEWRCDFPQKTFGSMEGDKDDPLLSSSELELKDLLNDNIQIPPLLSIFIQSNTSSRLSSYSLISNAKALKVDFPFMMNATFMGRNYLDWYLIADRVNFIENPLSFEDYTDLEYTFHRDYRFKTMSKGVSCKTITPCQLWRPVASRLDDPCLLVRFRNYKEDFAPKFDEVFRKDPARTLQSDCYIGRWYDDVQSPFEVALNNHFDFPDPYRETGGVSGTLSTLDEKSLVLLRKFRSTRGDSLISMYDKRHDRIVLNLEYEGARNADITKFKSRYAVERQKLRDLGFD